MDAFRRKRTEKLRTNSWFLLHNNAPVHQSVLVKSFLAKNNATELEHPPYDLFRLFFQLKSTLIGWQFFDTAVVIKIATEELKKVFTKWFPEMFPTLCSHW
jgi:hypothetical protein